MNAVVIGQIEVTEPALPLSRAGHSRRDPPRSTTGGTLVVATGWSEGDRNHKKYPRHRKQITFSQICEQVRNKAGETQFTNFVKNERLRNEN